MRMIEVKLAKAVQAGIMTAVEADTILQIVMSKIACELTEQQAIAMGGLVRHDYQEGQHGH